jgi:hypothetical protein
MLEALGVQPGLHPARFFVPTFSCALIFIWFFCVVPSVTAHGTAGKRIEKKTACVFFSYDDDEPMAYTKVTVNAPDSDLPFQSGATDRNGVACFASDKVGLWRITAGDGMGHQQTVSIAVAEEGEGSLVATQAAETTAGHDRRSGILAGLGIIFGCAGAIAWYRSRKRGCESQGRS